MAVLKTRQGNIHRLFCCFCCYPCPWLVLCFVSPIILGAFVKSGRKKSGICMSGWWKKKLSHGMRTHLSAFQHEYFLFWEVYWVYPHSMGLATVHVDLSSIKEKMRKNLAYLAMALVSSVSGVDTKMWALLRSQGANSVSCHMLDLILISHAMSRLQNKSWALWAVVCWLSGFQP